jgi:hypothetical protein
MECVRNCNVSGLTLVGQLPAAAQLDQQAVLALVQQALEQMGHRFDSGFPSSDVDGDGRYETVLCALLQQPAVQREPQDVVARLLATCTEGKAHALLLLRGS